MNRRTDRGNSLQQYTRQGLLGNRGNKEIIEQEKYGKTVHLTRD